MPDPSNPAARLSTQTQVSLGVEFGHSEPEPAMSSAGARPAACIRPGWSIGVLGDRGAPRRDRMTAVIIALSAARYYRWPVGGRACGEIHLVSTSM